MKLANVNNRKSQITHNIHSQIPTSVEWHKLTNWRNAEALYKFDRATWESFKREGKIPVDVILRVEKDGNLKIAKLKEAFGGTDEIYKEDK